MPLSVKFLTSWNAPWSVPEVSTSSTRCGGPTFTPPPADIVLLPPVFQASSLWWPALTVTTQSKEFKNPESWAWNFTVERQIPLNSTVSVAYVGRRGLHLQRESDINQPPAGTLQANPGVNLDALRPYKGYNSIRQTDNVASSRYNSFQATFNRRFANGVLFGVTYTLAKSEDDGSNQRDIIPDTYNAHNLWGPSEFDARHILVINGLYDLPFFRGQHNLASKVAGGWQISNVDTTGDVVRITQMTLDPNRPTAKNAATKSRRSSRATSRGRTPRP